MVLGGMARAVGGTPDTSRSSRATLRRRQETGQQAASGGRKLDITLLNPRDSRSQVKPRQRGTDPHSPAVRPAAAIAAGHSPGAAHPRLRSRWVASAMATPIKTMQPPVAYKGVQEFSPPGSMAARSRRGEAQPLGAGQLRPQGHIAGCMGRGADYRRCVARNWADIDAGSRSPSPSPAGCASAAGGLHGLSSGGASVLRQRSIASMKRRSTSGPILA